MSDCTYPAHLHLMKHRRSVALHERIAEKREPYYITEWRALFDQGVEATLAFMTDPGEHATQLR